MDGAVDTARALPAYTAEALRDDAFAHELRIAAVLSAGLTLAAALLIARLLRPSHSSPADLAVPTGSACG
ncbi:hypothetical protein GCM10010329_68390 [Streptomyces spiroverticillatus]|uniref:Uncharacterized protein n=1 Tax=Streptomyces finlayi TaxID=67296 RepID=A0A918X526_9ACTN|nr:hypothetical protein [Streptomyces finlayi]GHA35515.1 hypothetical protein GCM10010329_68390 [Streptomyces spiroverticillatus]GHD12800.1 hypothetical protein GCM10010334_70290 [Streptomyces finlayi]